MYIPLQENNEDKKFQNFMGLDTLFTKEQSFGDRVAADIAAVNKASQDRAMSKTTKAVIGVSIAAVIVFVGYKIIKKRKK